MVLSQLFKFPSKLIISKGLQSVLHNDTISYIDRTFLTDIDDKANGQKYSQSDTKSSKSETNSLKTCGSTANSKKSNRDADFITLSAEDITQKYNKDLRNIIKSILTIISYIYFNIKLRLHINEKTICNI